MGEVVNIFMAKAIRNHDADTRARRAAAAAANLPPDIAQLLDMLSFIMAEDTEYNLGELMQMHRGMYPQLDIFVRQYEIVTLLHPGLLEPLQKENHHER